LLFLIFCCSSLLAFLWRARVAADGFLRCNLMHSFAILLSFLVSGVNHLAMEREQLESIVGQIKSATESTGAIVVLGDFNLDAHRLKDESYSKKLLT
jgi:hypothetical protein